jgi:hypothetical protein
MNERITLLALKASDPKTGWLDRQKFAELIVRECAQVAKEVDGDEGDDYTSGRTWAGIDVLKHFGVEE